MKVLMIFAVIVTMLLTFYTLCMLAIAGFCYFMKRIERERRLSPRLAKLVYILDWLKEDKND